MILAIESSSNICSIATFDNDKIISSINIDGKNIHDRLLADTTQKLFQLSNIGINDINFISVNIGPGSFTGLRIGLSFAKGLIYGKEIKLVAPVSNDILFYSINKKILPINITNIATMISAGNDNFYFKLFKIHNREVIDGLQIINFNEIVDKIDKNTILVGNSLDSFTKLDNLLIQKDLLASDQLEITKKYIKDENFAEIKLIKPLYLNEINYKINN